MYIDTHYGTEACYDLCGLTREQLDFILKGLLIFSARSNEWHWFSGQCITRDEKDYINRLTKTYDDISSAVKEHFDGIREA